MGPQPANVTERFPIIEIPSQYWTLWNTVLQAVRSAQSIPIRNIGKLITKSASQWLITTDCRYIHQCQQDTYSVHRFLFRDKSTFHFALQPLFFTAIEQFDHLQYITPTLSNTIAITETSKLYKYIQPFIPKLKLVTKKMVSHLIKFTHKPKLLDKKPESIPPSPFLDPTYGDDKYSLYQDWWAIQRLIPR